MLRVHFGRAFGFSSKRMRTLRSNHDIVDVDGLEKLAPFSFSSEHCFLGLDVVGWLLVESLR